MPTKQTNPKWASILAREIMQSNVVTTSANTPLSEVVRLLSDQRISGLPITDEAGHVIGVLSMRDVLEYYANADVDRPRRTSSFYMQTDVESEAEEDFEVPEAAEGVAADVMTAEVYSVSIDSTLDDIARTFVEHGIHRVMVQDGKKFVGLIGTLDVLRAVTA